VEDHLAMEGSRKSEDIPLDSSSRAIMTNEVRWRRKITSNPCCSHCLTELETIITSNLNMGFGTELLKLQIERPFTPLTGILGY